MKILFITRRFYPHGDATSGIVMKLSEYYVQKGYDVSVFSLTNYKSDSEITKYNGINIFNYYISELNDNITNMDIQNQNIFGTAVHYCRKQFFRVKRRIGPSCLKYSLNPLLVWAFKKGLYQLCSKNEFDLYIVTVMPHEAAWVITKNKIIKNKPVIFYQLDTYWNNDSFPSKFKDSRFVFENQFMESSAFTITTPQIFTKNIERNPLLKDKMIAAEFPIISELNYLYNSECSEEKNKIECVFLGTLYKKIRPPEKIISIISKIDSDNIVFKFYGNGQNMIEELQDYLNTKCSIDLCGLVSNDESESIKCNADFLVNIDNTSVQQVPSKIFEYINTGKPIINFYFNKDSYVLDYLRKYQLCININVNEESVEESANRIKHWIKENKGARVPYEYIKENYNECTVEYVANQFLRTLKKI